MHRRQPLPTHGARVFDQDEDGVVLLLNEYPPDEMNTPVLDAVQRCPASVITVLTEKTT